MKAFRLSNIDGLFSIAVLCCWLDTLRIANGSFTSSSKRMHSRRRLVAPILPLVSPSQNYCNDRYTMGLSRCFATIEETDTTSKLAAAASPTTTKAVWFPTRIQDALDDYHTTVQRLFVRHIVTETQSMAQWALQQSTQYSTISSNGLASDEQSSTATKFRADPFGATAAALSACLATREDGGTIGWVERPDSLLLTESTVPSSILSSNVINDLFQLQPKAGDVYTLEDELEQRWHVIQVAEIWMNRTVATTKRQQSMLVSESLSVPTDNRLTVVPGAIGHYQGANVVVPRRQLKGHGVRPLFPEQLSTFHIQTAGCQMNVADSERLAGILQNDLQLQVSNEPTQADVVLFNTCSIRDHAEQKLYDVLGPYAAAKRQGKKRMVLVVTGCVAQQEGEALVRRVPEIDIVLGPQYIPHFQNILEQILEHGNPVVATAPMLLPEHNDNAGLFNKPVRGHDVRAWVNVIHGCNEHCTYCVVPATRGMEQSRTPESIYRECLALGEAGYKEVTLLGQNIDAYGRDMIPKRTFAGLLEYLNANLPDKMRIRYVTSHPRYFSDRVIDAVADLDKVCECFHVPFQAGDDDVLRRMRRGYTYESYMKIIRKIKAKAPDAAICADIIVGFPGETDEAFQKTLQLMEEVKFDNVNSFAYSPRPNTEAALWTDQIDEGVKSERLQLVQQLATKHGLERSERYLGRIVQVLVEDANPRDPLQVMGRTRQGRQVYFTGDLSRLRGELVLVKVTEARTWSLMGEQLTLER